MSLIQLSPSNGDSLLINSGSFSTGKTIRTRNELVFYTDQYGNSTGYRWLGMLPHTINGNSPQNDGGISSSSWESYITSDLYDKLKSENITLTGTAHIPTVEVAYGLPKGSLKVWTPGENSSSSQYWLYTDGTVWGGVGVLGTVPSSPFNQIHLQRDNIKYSYIVQSNGMTQITIPYTFTDVSIYLNGMLLNGETGSYTVSGSTIFFSNVLMKDDDIQCILNNVPVSSLVYISKDYLQSSSGAGMIGTSNGSNVQEELDNLNNFIQNDIIITKTESNVLFPTNSSISFGTLKNNSTINVDNRGRLSVSTKTNGLNIASNVHVPFSESTGYYKGPFPDTLVKFPTADEPDDLKSHGLLFSYDIVRNKPRAFLTSPYTTSFHGYSTPDRTWGSPITNQVLEIATFNEIGNSQRNSYDTYFTLDSNNKNYYKLATISNDTNVPGAFFTCVLSIGNYLTKKRSFYTLNVQTPDLTADLNVLSIMDMVKLTSVDGNNTATSVASVSTPSVDAIQAGLVKTSTGFDVWLALPAHSTYFSCNVLNTGNEKIVKFDWSILKSNSGLSTLSGTPASGTVWAPIDSVYDTRRTIPLNDGTLFYVPYGYMMLRLHANSTVVSVDPRFQWISPFCRRSVIDTQTASVSTIGCTISSSVFTITGCDIATNQPVYVTRPNSISNQGDLRVVVSGIDNTNHTFKISVVQNTQTATTTADTVGSTTTYSTTLTDIQTPIDPPSDTWIDVLVKLV